MCTRHCHALLYPHGEKERDFFFTKPTNRHFCATNSFMYAYARWTSKFYSDVCSNGINSACEARDEWRTRISSLSLLRIAFRIARCVWFLYKRVCLLPTEKRIRRVVALVRARTYTCRISSAAARRLTKRAQRWKGTRSNGRHFTNMNNRMFPPPLQSIIMSLRCARTKQLVREQ